MKKYFQHVINTHSLGSSKALPKIIRLVLKKFRFKARETVMIDEQDFNLFEPKKRGVHTVLYKNPAQLLREAERILSLKD